MKVTDFVLDYNGEPFKDNGVDLTWREVIKTSLNSILTGENLPDKDKIKMFQLTLRACTSDEVDFSLEERAFIVGRINKIYNPLICGRAEEFFK